MLESTLLSVHLEGNLGLEIDLSIIHTSFEPFPQDTLRDSVAEVGALGTRAGRPRSLQVWAPSIVGASISTTWKFT